MLIQRLPRVPSGGASYYVNYVDYPSAVNGTYDPTGGSVAGKPQYKHQTQDYWLTWNSLILGWTLYDTASELSDPGVIETDYASNNDAAPDGGSWTTYGTWSDSGITVTEA